MSARLTDRGSGDRDAVEIHISTNLRILEGIFKVQYQPCAMAMESHPGRFNREPNFIPFAVFLYAIYNVSSRWATIVSTTASLSTSTLLLRYLDHLWDSTFTINLNPCCCSLALVYLLHALVCAQTLRSASKPLGQIGSRSSLILHHFLEDSQGVLPSTQSKSFSSQPQKSSTRESPKPTRSTHPPSLPPPPQPSGSTNSNNSATPPPPPPQTMPDTAPAHTQT